MSSTIKAAILALKSRIADAYTAISNKGGTLPETQDSANLATAIASIPSGGGDPYDIYFPDWHNPMDVLKAAINETYKGGICYLFKKSTLSVTSPTCDRVVFADGTYIDNPSGTINLTFDTEEKETNYIICLYTTAQASVTASFNDTTLWGMAAYNIALSLGTSSASNFTVAEFEKCAITTTVRKPIYGSYSGCQKYYYDKECSFSYVQYSNIFVDKYCYLYSEYEWPNSQYISQVFTNSTVAWYASLPNATGNHFANQGQGAPLWGTFGTLYAPKMNTFPNIRNGICYNMILGKITFVDDWAMNTLSYLAYVEIGEDTDIDMNLKNSKIYTNYISTQGGIDMINANLVKGIGNKVKDNSTTGVTRVLTLPASVYAVLTAETKAVFTNKGWSIGGA